jgi:hypothetical protein
MVGRPNDISESLQKTAVCEKKKGEQLEYSKAGRSH